MLQRILLETLRHAQVSTLHLVIIHRHGSHGCLEGQRRVGTQHAGGAPLQVDGGHAARRVVLTRGQGLLGGAAVGGDRLHVLSK